MSDQLDDSQNAIDSTFLHLMGERLSHAQKQMSRAETCLREMRVLEAYSLIMSGGDSVGKCIQEARELIAIDNRWKQQARQRELGREGS